MSYCRNCLSDPKVCPKSLREMNKEFDQYAEIRNMPKESAERLKESFESMGLCAPICNECKLSETYRSCRLCNTFFCEPCRSKLDQELENKQCAGHCKKTHSK
jgi:hypothetical protein